MKSKTVPPAAALSPAASAAAPAPPPAQSPEETQRTLAELRARLVELERQNTQLRQTQAAGQLVEVKLRQLSWAMEQSNTSIIITDLAGNIEYVNTQFTALTGYTLAEVRGKNPRLLQSGRTSPATYRELWAALTAGREWRGDFQNRKKDGELYWETVAIAPVRDEAGRVTHYVGVKHNISEHHQLQAALRTSEKNFRTFFDTVVDLIVVSRPDGRLLYANPPAASKLGYDSDALIEMRLLDLYVPAHRREIDLVLATLGPGEPALIPLPLATKSGACLPVETRTWRGEWNGTDCIFHYCKDLTQEQAALQTLNRVFDLNPAIMALTEVPGETFTSVNAAFLRTLGYAREEVLGRTAAELALFVQPEAQRQRQAQLVTTGSLTNCELQVRCRDGTILDGLFYMEHLVVQGRKLWLTVMVDITEQRQVQKALRKSLEVLSQTNQELLATTSRANDLALKAGQANTAKSAFLAAMSHELRSPLTAVLGFGEILAERRHGPLNEPQLRFVQLIQDSGQHLLSLINDILDLARVEADQLVLYWEPVSVAELCAAALHVVGPLARKKRITLTQDLQHAPAQWLSDNRRLKQILLNLLTNAVKFTPEDGQVGLEVSGGADGLPIEFIVWDNGIGIAPADQAQLFQPFVQIDSKLSRQHAGTGLGLSLVTRLCQLLGGTVSLASAPGHGSRFRVVLPRPASPGPGGPSQAADSGPGVESSRPAAPAAPERPEAPLILLVDDDDAVLGLYSSSLSLSGEFRVLLAHTGTEALRLLGEQCPALVVTDIQMPDLDGLELIGRIRQGPAPVRGVPIVALTALAMAGDRERCLAAGADVVRNKPIPLKELRALILQWVAPPAPSLAPGSNPQTAASVPPNSP